MREFGLLAASAFVTRCVAITGRFSKRRATPRRILVVKLDHLGDLLLATPALRALRDSHPGIAIDALVLPGSRALLDGSPLVDRVLSYDAPRFRRLGSRAPTGGGADAAAPWGRIREIGRGGYDWIVELRGDPWTTWLLPLLARPARRLDRGSVRLADWIARRADRIRGKRVRPVLHEVETNLAVVRAVVARRAETPRVELPPWTDAAEILRDALAERDIPLDLTRPYIVVHPGATWTPRAWRPENFTAVAAALRATYDAPIVLIGVAHERPLLERISAASPPGVHVLAGALELPPLSAILRDAVLFVGNDGGMAHLAAACGTPSVVLFGPQNPARFRPWSPSTVVLHHPVSCFPCAQVRCVRPEEPCVNLIEVSEVLRAAGAILAAHGVPASPRSERP
jgi:heptosyltransferase-2/heptosyltransferase-3